MALLITLESHGTEDDSATTTKGRCQDLPLGTGLNPSGVVDYCADCGRGGGETFPSPQMRRGVQDQWLMSCNDEIFLLLSTRKKNTPLEGRLSRRLQNIIM